MDHFVLIYIEMYEFMNWWCVYVRAYVHARLHICINTRMYPPRFGHGYQQRIHWSSQTFYDFKMTVCYIRTYSQRGGISISTAPLLLDLLAVLTHFEIHAVMYDSICVGGCERTCTRSLWVLCTYVRARKWSLHAWTFTRMCFISHFIWPEEKRIHISIWG
jgi:hypothetical protein